LAGDRKAKGEDAVVNSNDVARRIAEAVTRFEKTYMALQPKSVLVDVHESRILVTLRQVASEAERECASDVHKRDLLEKLSSAAFDTVKSELETEVAAIVGRAVRRSRINVDPVAGDAIVSFILEESHSTEERR
jgi:uncharacterized protein YbcI